MAWVYGLGFVVARGFRGMVQAPLVQLLSIATIAVCMLLLGTVVLIWSNANTITQAWGIDVPVTAYLVSDADDASIADAATQVEALPYVEQVDRVDSAEAMKRLAAGLGEQSEMLDGIDAQVLPASLEIHLAADDAHLGSQLAEQIASFEVVDEVAVAGPWVGQARDALHTIGSLAIGAAALVAFACMAIVGSTIRLGVYARRAEIQILRLVGGTARFVRGPFLVEGTLQGALGAGLALLLLYLGFNAIAAYLERGLSLVFAAGALRFLTPLELVAGVGFGALIGLLGSRAAAAHYVET